MKRLLYCLILLFGVFATVYAEDYSVNYEILLRETGGSYKPIEEYTTLKKDKNYELQVRCNIQRPWNVKAGVIYLPVWLWLSFDKDFYLSIPKVERFNSYHYRNYYYSSDIQDAEERYKTYIEEEGYDTDYDYFYKTVVFLPIVWRSGDNTSESFYIKFSPNATGRFGFYLYFPSRFINEDEALSFGIDVVN